MRYIFCTQTVGHVYLFNNIIKTLAAHGHESLVITRGNRHIVELLDDFHLPYKIYVKETDIKKGLKRTLQLPGFVWSEYKLAKDFHPNIIIGTGPDEPLFSRLLGKPCILFTDHDHIPFQHLSNRIFAKKIITPSCFTMDLGRKHVRIEGYKELAYLAPGYFAPDEAIYTELGLSGREKYIIIRFCGFEAVHDIGKHGFTPEEKIRLVREMEKRARVFLSPESQLPAELERYRLPSAFDRIHHALYYAQLLITDSGTMATEAAVLGTPVVRLKDLASKADFGNFIELEDRFDLLYSVKGTEAVIKKAAELIENSNTKDEWAQKRQAFLASRIDVTQFMVQFIQDYPEKRG